MNRITITIAINAALLSCSYDTHFQNCVVSCASDLLCPDGLTCDEGMCRAPGAMCTTIALDGGNDSDASLDAGPPPPPPSCLALASTCGLNGVESCCAAGSAIQGGTFLRSFDVGSDGMYTDTSYPATVSAFQLDRFEVTVGRFRAFVSTNEGTQANPPPQGSGARTLNGSASQGGWDLSWDGSLAATTSALVGAIKCDATHETWTDAPGSDEALPMTCVTWYEAFAFCAWDGGFLPTEAEWNYAAAGGDQQRAYPWSSPPGSLTADCAHANYNVNVPSGTYCVDATTGNPNRVGGESPTGDSLWGQADLGGDVDEWVLDWYVTPYTTPCDACADLTSSGERVVRGGDWANASTTLRTASRNFTSPDNRDAKLGFRCARP